MRVLSPLFLQSIHGQESGEVFLPLVKLTHANFTSDLRWVPNWEDVTHNAEIYSPMAFQITLPDDADEGFPVLRWSIDNVSQEAIVELRSVTGPIDARIVWVLASQPDTVEVGPFDLQIRAAEYDLTTISGSMSIEPILEEQFGYLTMTPKNAPGLF